MKDCFGSMAQEYTMRFQNECTHCRDAAECHKATDCSTLPPGYPPVTNPMRDDDASLHEAEERILATRLDSLLKEAVSNSDAPQQKKALQPALHRQEGGEHYTNLGDYQPWLVLKAWMTEEEFRGYMKGTAIVYLAREQSKGKDLDIAKALHTLEGLSELRTKEPHNK